MHIFLSANAVDAITRNAASRIRFIASTPFFDRSQKRIPYPERRRDSYYSSLASSWDQSARETLRTRVLQALERVCPGAPDAIVAEQLLTPLDLEARYGVRGGHLYRGEQALDQLWVQRPSLALCRYATPIAGLFLCGAASHPGGPFAGGAGILGARTALKG